MPDPNKTCGTCYHWANPLPEMGDHGETLFSFHPGSGQCRKGPAHRGGVHTVSHFAYSDSWGWTLRSDGCFDGWTPKEEPGSLADLGAAFGKTPEQVAVGVEAAGKLEGMDTPAAAEIAALAKEAHGIDLPGEPTTGGEGFGMGAVLPEEMTTDAHPPDGTSGPNPPGPGEGVPAEATTVTGEDLGHADEGEAE